MNVAERIERIVTGVIRQALLDAGETTVAICGEGADAALLRTWCERSLGGEVVAAGGLALHPANKTALLLTKAPRAAVLPFGDLFYSQLSELAGAAALPPLVEKLAASCGGAAALDEALRCYFDERRSWAHATQRLPSDARDRLQRHLNAARFQRLRVPLIPKLGARTLGIDLYA